MRNQSPHTRETLLLRLRDVADEDSWAEFAEIYTPLLYAYCQKREIKHADAADIVQEVMKSVAKAMQGFHYDPGKGAFKAWLFTCLRHAIGDHYRKQSRRPITAAETLLVSLIDSEPQKKEVDEWELDYQRQLLAWVIERIKPEFSERIWEVFDQTALQDRDPSEVAKSLGMSTNAVAVAKHRVVKRLRDKAHSIDAQRWEEEMITNSKKA